MLRRPPGSTRTDTPFPYTTLFRSLDLGGRSEGAHRDASARTLDIAHHLAEVAARLDIYCVILPEPLDRKGMLIRAERACGGREGRKLGRLGHAFGIGGQTAHANIVDDADLIAQHAVITSRGKLPPPPRTPGY